MQNVVSQFEEIMSLGRSLKAWIVWQVDWVLVISSNCFREKAVIATFVGHSRCQFLLYRVVKVSYFLSVFNLSVMLVFCYYSSFLRILTSLCKKWSNLIVICCSVLRSLSKGPSVTTVERTPQKDSSKHHRQEQLYRLLSYSLQQSSKYWSC